MPGPLGVISASPALVGRERELEALDLLIDRVRAGAGATLLIAGEAGIGKSRLILEARRRFQRDLSSGLVLTGNCFELDQDFPVAPIVDLLQRWFSEPGHGTHGQPEPQFPDIDRYLSGSADSVQEKRRILQSLRQFLGQLSKSRPLLVVIEDLHWSDEATLELVPYLSRFVAERPILLLLSYRIDEVTGSLGHMLATLDRERLATELVLSSFERDEIDVFLREIFSQSQPIRADFLDMIQKLSDGNPFFIEEMVRSLIASGDIYFADGHWHRKEAHELHVPRSVRDAVQRRVSGLRRETGEALALAAVTGRHFSFGVIQELTGMDEESLLACLRELIDNQLISEESADQFAFRHALTRQAIYSELLTRERQRLHRAVAEAIERQSEGSRDQAVADLAYHYDQAGVWEKSFAYAVHAGERAQSLFSPRAAAEHFTRALRAGEHLSMLPDPNLYRKRGMAYTTLGQFELAQGDFDAMLELVRETGDRDLEWEALLDLGDLWTGRDYDRSGRYFQQALDLAREIEDPIAVARSLVQIGNWQVNAERVEEAEQALTAALSMFEALNDPAGTAEAHDLLGVVADVSGDQLLMRERYEKAAELYQALDNRKGVASVRSNIAMTAGGYLLFETISQSGGVSASEAESMGNYVANLAREIDWYAGEAFALISLAFHHRAQGRYDRALTHGLRSLEISEAIDHQEWITVSRIVLGCIHSDLLDLSTAGDLFDQAADLARDSGSILWQQSTAGFLGSNRVLEGKLDEAEWILHEYDEHLPVNTIGPRLIWSAKARLALAFGDAATALETIDRLFANARNFTAEHDIPTLAKLRAESLIGLKRFDEAEKSLLSAKSGALMYGLRSLLWRIQIALGNLKRTMGREQEATAEFMDAQATIESLTATVSDEPLREYFLSRAFAMIPAHQLPNNSLTPREREVAELVAQGMSNREIADSLFIGERTVETHVGNILAKLGFTSRTQVAAWMVESGLENAPG